MSLGRRVAVVVTALVVAAVVLRPQLSSALLTRGDTLAYWGYRQEARRAYERALAFDASNGAAADRLVFDSAVSGDRDAIGEGVAAATRFLALQPHDAAVLMDRAFCYQHLGAYELAADDFYSAGVIARDARALMFAALDKRRLRDDVGSRRLLREAVAVDPRFVPAARALRRSLR
jgi:tetratricopeptide (TPR) repeat protein